MNSNDDKSNSAEFSIFFKTTYEKRLLSKAELSRLSGVSEATLSRIEKGLQKPSPYTLKKLAPWLSISENELMRKAGYLEDDTPTPFEAKSPEDKEIFSAVARAKDLPVHDKKLVANMLDTLIDTLTKNNKKD